MAPNPATTKTYRVHSPPSTHWRAATCAEVNCPNHTSGFRIEADPTSILGRHQIDYLRSRVHRRWFTEHLTPGGLVAFEFPPGQECFVEHEVRVRPELYLVRAGTHDRPGELIRRHDNPDHWVEDMSETLDRCKTIIERG